MTIRCNCLKPHHDHQFRAEQTQPLLCRDCMHNLAAHAENPLLDQIVMLLGIHEIESWACEVQLDGVLMLTLRLTPPANRPEP